MSKETRDLVRRHNPTAALNARRLGLDSIIRIHGATYTVFGNGRGAWDALLVRDAPPMARRRGPWRRFSLWAGRVLDRLASATERAAQERGARLW